MWGGSAESLRQTLNTLRPRRFLFSGHCNAPSHPYVSPALTRPGGGIEIISPTLLADVIGGQARDRLELVLLNGCESLELGRALRRAGVPYVVCWSTDAHDEAASKFAAEFFRCCAAGKGPEEAFEEGRLAVRVITHRVDDNTLPGQYANLQKFELREPGSPPIAAITAGTPTIAAGIPMLLTADREVDGRETPA
jgi:predicted RNase H-like HicB family nuclease